jgi:hypothetical protein
MASAFSLPQCFGYIALVLGVSSFLQKKDSDLKKLNTAQCVVYCIHFCLLGNFPAAASNVISGVRNIVSLKTNSIYAAYILAACTIGMGFITIRTPAGLIPVVTTIIAIFGMFLLQGIRFRLIMLFCTSMWLINNILCHSIGGMILETLIATANTTTITRLYFDKKRKNSLPNDDGSAWPPNPVFPKKRDDQDLAGK